jgi:hypothetical protein
MTLLDKFSRLSLLIAVVFGLLSCEDPSEVGLPLSPDGTLIDVLFEEIELPISTVFIDSVRTSADARLLVGRYNDPVFGESSSISHSQLGLAKTTFTKRDEDRKTGNEYQDKFVLDSVYLQLRLNYYHSDRIGQSQSIKVVQVEDTLFRGVSYYSNFPSLTESTSKVYGEAEFSINPANSSDSLVRIDLPVFGQEVLSYMNDYNTGSISQDSILNRIRGIALVPGDNNSALIGFSPSSADTKLGFYYHLQNIDKDTLVADSLSIEFNFNLTSNVNFATQQQIPTVRYNAFTTDRSNALLNTPENLKELSIDNGKAYLQGATGIYPKISLQPLNDFLAHPDTDTIEINRADFEIVLDTDVNNPDNIGVANNLQLFFDKGDKDKGESKILNSSSSVILSNSSYLSNASIPALAVLDTDNAFYQAHTTLFTQFLNSKTIEVNDLILVPLDNTSYNQSVIDASSVKLKVYYTIPRTNKN